MRLIMCDGNRILCEALADAMAARGHKVVAITATVADGLAAVAEHRPDAVVLDPCSLAEEAAPAAAGADGLRAARIMREHSPMTSVLVLSSLATPAAWSAAKEIGVAGFLQKDSGVREIAGALDVIAEGRVAFDSRLSCRESPKNDAGRHRAPTFYVLTPREKEVLRRIIAGQGTAQMASEMHITPSTLRTYVKNLLTKLGAHSRLEAAALAARGDLPCGLSA